MNSLYFVNDSVVSKRAAFTLLEVIIATALSSVVLVLVYSSIDIAARLSTSGQTKSSDDAVARSVIFQIKDDLKFTASSSADYFQALALSSFEFDKYAKDFLSEELQNPGVILSERCVLIERPWSLPGMENSKEGIDRIWGAKRWIAYFVSRSRFEDDLATCLKEMGIELDLDDSMSGYPLGLHRCFLMCGDSNQRLKLVQVDPVFERPEVAELVFSHFQGNSWKRPRGEVVTDPLAIRIDLKTTRDSPANPTKENAFAPSRRSASDEKWHQLVTRLYRPLANDR